MLPTKKELFERIQSDKELALEYASWKGKYQQEFLDFCTGEKGVKVLYDSFFKEVLHPEYAAGRLEDWLSVVLGERVTILTVLPNDSTRIADETSLLVTDIVVELEDGSRHAGSTCRLHADHLDLWIQQFCKRRHTRCQTAATDWN